ncbi:NAD(P)-binding protein [Rhizobium sp. DKSPLA3]|uniref:NAD(P)-binding protein n=1 Tax=Rhizobium quercicola TaxID=2901226 RepID=A0A9X1T585_9HYPH|nr:FAD-dependent oxidoreductase [Rhizobium quercicola]MCD7107488.1 NAD(P)-binding protein [Rhizobium quercicola]
MSDPKRVAIIGAGMAGLTLARALAGHAAIRIFEKSRGIGGRMATRRIEDRAFDHGAQYITIREPRFRDLLDAAAADGAVERWNRDIVSLPAARQDGPRADAPRYVGKPAMNALPKWMARDCDIAFDTEISSVSGTPGHWTLTAGAGEDGPFDWIVATAPAPQSAALLPPAFAHHAAMQTTRMHACFTLMVPLKPGAATPFAAARLDDPVISWISRNDTKPGRDDAPCLVVNAGPEWSDRHIEAPLESLRVQIIEAVRRYVPLDSTEADSAVIKRWRYANVARPAGQPFLLDPAQQLASCGDWCIAGRVEAAFESASRLADALLPALRETPP